MTPSSSLDKAVLAAVKGGFNKFSAIFLVRFPLEKERRVDRALQRLRLQGAIRYDRRKGWTPT